MCSSLCASVAVTTTLLERQIHGSRRPIWSHGGWSNKARREDTTRRGCFIGVEALDCTPLPHNEMLARTYSASNLGSITPLANQMTALNQSANGECLNSWVLFGAHRSPSRAHADISSPAKRSSKMRSRFRTLRAAVGVTSEWPVVQHSKIGRRNVEMGHSRHSRHPGVSGSPQERMFGQCPRV